MLLQYELLYYKLAGYFEISLSWKIMDIISKSVYKTIVSNSHARGKDTVAVFVDFLYNHFDDPGAVHDIIWSHGPSSDFKNMVKLNSW